MERLVAHLNEWRAQKETNLKAAETKSLGAYAALQRANAELEAAIHLLADCHRIDAESGKRKRPDGDGDGDHALDAGGGVDAPEH